MVMKLVVPSASECPVAGFKFTPEMKTIIKVKDATPNQMEALDLTVLQAKS
jgi:hypothetical protein